MEDALTVFLLLLTTLVAADQPYQDHPPCHIKYQQFQDHTMCLHKAPGARSINMTDEWKQQIIDSHNDRRSKTVPPATNMMKVRWDDELEEMSRRWSDACEFRAGLQHDTQRFVPGSFFVGQSMSSTTIDFNVAMEFWWVEKEAYTFGKDYEEQKFEGQCGFSVGHYTQMAWAETYLVGCAATTCNNKDNVIVCNYGPTGNQLPFDNPYIPGPQCSKCKHCTEEGLCDCGEVHCHMGKLNPSTCTCDCTFPADGVVPDFVQEPDCSLNCSGTDFHYCGYEPFHICSDSWTALKCPHMCNICPYGEKGYVPPTATSSGEQSSYTGSGTYGSNDTLSINGTLSMNDTLSLNDTLTYNDTLALNSSSIEDMATYEIVPGTN